MTKRKPKRFSAFLWHRRIGLMAMLLVVVLAVTGIMLNHTERLRLASTYVTGSWLLQWYGIEPRDEPVSFRVGGHTISAWQQRLFFDGRNILRHDQPLHGAIAAERFIVIALENELILLDNAGNFIERVNTGLSFSKIRRLGVKYQRPVIETSDPLYYMADEHILDWDVIVNEDIEWSTTTTLTPGEKQRLLEAYRGKGLKLERVILDLHSGRLFGRYGPYLMDAAALGLLWLSLSGLWVWGSRRRKMRQKRHYRKHHR